MKARAVEVRRKKAGAGGVGGALSGSDDMLTGSSMSGLLFNQSSLSFVNLPQRREWRYTPPRKDFGGIQIPTYKNISLFLLLLRDCSRIRGRHDVVGRD